MAQIDCFPPSAALLVGRSSFFGSAHLELRFVYLLLGILCLFATIHYSLLPKKARWRPSRPFFARFQIGLASPCPFAPLGLLNCSAEYRNLPVMLNAICESCSEPASFRPSAHRSEEAQIFFSGFSIPLALLRPAAIPSASALHPPFLPVLSCLPDSAQ